MKRPLALLLLLTAAAVGLTACGQSSQDKAKSQVCDARSDISKQVNELKGLTLATATVDGVKTNVQAIQDDLGKIKDAQGDLNADRKKQVQAANEAFTQQVKSIASSVGQSLSLSNAGTQLQTAVSQLAASYQQTLAKIDCS
jgi:Tfp pilus assembly protein PilP